MEPDGRARGARHVPLAELVDPALLAPDGRAQIPRDVRAALPPGWVLDDDGATAHRDLRLLFRRGWLLAIGLVLFGAAGAVFFVEVLPRGWSGAARFAALVLVILCAGGVVGPIVTKSLYRKR